jgi:hypothetical protein
METLKTMQNLPCDQSHASLYFLRLLTLAHQPPERIA